MSILIDPAEVQTLADVVLQSIEGQGITLSGADLESLRVEIEAKLTRRRLAEYVRARLARQVGPSRRSYSNYFRSLRPRLIEAAADNG